MEIQRSITVSAAECGVQAVEILVRLHLLKFYVDTVGLPADWASYAVGTAIVWDAVSDPLVGILSDRVKERHGSRKPFMMAGAILMAVATVAIFSPPRDAAAGVVFGFLLVSYLLLNTGMTLVAVPHAALISEIAESAAERARLFGFRLGLGNLGLVLGTLMPGLLVATTPGSAQADLNPPSYFTTGLSVAAIVVGSAWFTVRAQIAIPPPSVRYDPAQPRPSDGFRALGQALKNRAFIPLFLAYAVAMMGMGVNGSLALYYYVDRIHLEQDQISVVLLIFLLAWTGSIAFWVTVGNRVGKRLAGFWGILALGILTSAAYPFFPPDQIAYPIAIAVVGGFLIGAVVLLDAVVGDIVDYDEIKTGRRREGVYFGFWKLGGKLARALSIVIAGLVLDAIGVQPKAPRTEETVMWIGWLFGPGVGAFFIAGAFLFLAMPLSKLHIERIGRLQAKLRSRRHRRAASEPRST